MQRAALGLQWGEESAAQPAPINLADRLPAAYYVADLDGGWLRASPRMQELLGFTVTELMQDRTLLTSRVLLQDRAALSAARQALLSSGASSTQYRLLRRDGQLAWVADECSRQSVDPAPTRAGGPLALTLDFGVLRDITDAKRAEQLATGQRDVLRAAADDEVPVELLRRVCGFVEQVSGVGQCVVEWQEPSQPASRIGSLGLLTAVVMPPVFTGRFEIIGIGRGRVLLSYPLGVLPQLADERLVARSADFAQRLLSGPIGGQVADPARASPGRPALADRAAFVERVDGALAGHRQRGTSSVAVLLIDLDDFKTVNDGLGHAIGDQVLNAVGARLRACLRTDDSAGRLTGDEFVVMLGDLGGVAEASYAAERILLAISRPMVIEGHVLTTRASVGIAVAQGEEDAEDLLRNADLAMYSAKREGGAGSRQYRRSMRHDALTRLELKADLERAVASEALDVFYQPVVDLHTGRIVALEALVRWNHPTRGMITPIDFIPLAEESDLIARLGRWVLRQACAETALWRSTIPGQEDLVVNVNLSPRQLSNTGFPDEVRRILWSCGLPANAVVLEITETVLAEPGVDVVKVLHELRRMGLGLALDDFGTGYSSLAQLAKYPLTILKVDKSFVEEIEDELANATLAKAVLNIAAALSLHVTVEGVETAAQLQVLRQLGATNGQGYLMSRPVPRAEVTKLLERLVIGLEDFQVRESVGGVTSLM